MNSLSDQPAGCISPDTDPATISRTASSRNWRAALFLLVITVIAYLPIWRAGFIMDDQEFWVGTPLMKQGDGLVRFWGTTEAPDYFPMASTVTWFGWRLWGENPLGYHLVNVFLHALSVLVLWRVLARLNVPGSWLAAAIFALHPVNVESVAWISEIKNTLAMFFFAVTILAWLRFDDTTKRSWYVAAMVAFALALLSKTAAAPLPVVLLGLAWWKRGRLEARDVWRSIPFFIIAAGLAIVTLWFHHRVLDSTITIRDDSFWSRLAGAGWAIWFYWYKALLPMNLNFIYPRWQIHAANVVSWIPILSVAAVLLMCWRYRRGWGRPGLFALGYFIVMLLPVLGFVNISFMRYSLVADRWQYFAILGPIALVAGAITGALRKIEVRNTVVSVLKPPICGIVLLSLAALTWQQCRMYVNAETLWQTTLARNPNCALACNNLANDLLDKGQVAEAVVYLQKALKLDPDSVNAHVNLGNACLQQGRLDEAIVQFEKAVALEPAPNALCNLAIALCMKGLEKDGVAYLEKALELDPAHADAHYNLGNIRLRQGRLDEALSHFKKALQTSPAADAHNNIGQILFQQGRVNEAIDHLQSALAIQPALVEAHETIALAWLRKGEVRQAIVHFEASIRLQPDRVRALSGLAWVRATWPDAVVRNGNEAIGLALRANQLAGGQNPAILQTLAAAYAEAGRFADALATAQRAMQLAESKSDNALAQSLQSQLALYQAGSPFRDQPVKQ